MANYFVSTSGSDTNPGKTLAKPFQTIAKGISVLKAGDVLNLRGGNYVKPVKVYEKHGTKTCPNVIRSYADEHATIDGSIPEFGQGTDDWELASLQEPNNPKVHPEEFVSKRIFALNSSEDQVNRGAFLDRVPYTRLITYSKLNDLRATNQTWGKVYDDSLEGPEVTDKNGNPKGFKRPWVYMGPGLFLKKTTDLITGQITGRIHIRLSHTTNNIDGLEDYRGEINPNKVRLAISDNETTTLLVEKSSYVRFENLSIRFGGDYTLKTKKTQSIVFDHVRILAASCGVQMGAGAGTILRHCEVSGGLPDWYFRSDRKDEYYFKDGDTVVLNGLGSKTSLTLLFGIKENTGLEIYNCEFLDAHDLSFFGKEVRFHHNWVHNLNDEALILDGDFTYDLRIFRNVITQCLSAISFAGNKVGGPIYIYRNLIDLRRPTGGFRPTPKRDREVFRYGHLYKHNIADGPFDLFQNTFLVLRQDGHVSYSHYGNTGGNHLRRSFNNIFIAVNPDSASDKPIMYLPPPSFPGPTDGNCYFRIGQATQALFLFKAYNYDGAYGGGKFNNLESLRIPNAPWPQPGNSIFFEQSRTQYPPGYEAVSIEADPRFRQIGADGIPQSNDDLRLRSDSPARRKGQKQLPPDLRTLDALVVSPSQGKPDIGCYEFGTPGLRVGVDGRRHFP